MVAAEGIAELNTPYRLSQEQVQRFHDEGFIKLKDVLSPQTLDRYGTQITNEVQRLNTQIKPMDQRTTYEKAFLQIMNIWRQDALVREFVFSRRLARLAAELMRVEGVRLYHDQALYKEGGGGFTPWHADQFYWPLEGNNTCTVWIPLQQTPLEMGPLAFSVGSHRFEFGRALEISDESEQQIRHALAEQNFPMDEGPFDLGEVSFHWGWTFHRAGANRTDRPRAVMTMIYLADGTVLKAPKNRHQVNDWHQWLPGARIGQPVATDLNPLLYRADAPA